MTARWQAHEIDPAVQALRRGELVAFPTETVYGLGADASSDKAVASVFAAKGRPEFNPLIAHVADESAARKLAWIPEAASALTSAFWPGPLTIVAPMRHDAPISKLVTAGLPTIAVRVPAHPLAQVLLRAFGGPIAAPSANLSGKLSPTTADHVLAGLSGKIAGVLDGGPTKVGLESAIVGFIDGQPTLLRQGGIAPEALEAVLSAPLAAPKSDEITAPGQLLSHYAPSARLRLDAEEAQAGEALLGFGGAPGGAMDLSPKGDLTEAAANLFAMLHRLDEVADRIAVSPIPEVGLGRAINDRLRRAAATREDVP